MYIEIIRDELITTQEEKQWIENKIAEADPLLEVAWMGTMRASSAFTVIYIGGVPELTKRFIDYTLRIENERKANTFDRFVSEAAR